MSTEHSRVCAVGLLVWFCVSVSVDAQSTNAELKTHQNWSLLPLSKCGQVQVKATIQSRIMGGEQATLGEFPWVANLFISNGSRGENRPCCGGSVISERYILTAAHCCEADPIQGYWIRLGEHDLSHEGGDCSSSGCAPPPQDIAVEQLIVHENYTSVRENYDVCLIRLKEPITFNDFVQPICLPTEDNAINYDYVGEELQVAGWGYSDKFPSSTTPSLQRVDLTVVSEESCSDEYPNIDTNEICAGGFTGTQLKQFCIGDSGGPLMKSVETDGTKQAVLVGVVSYVAVTKVGNLTSCKEHVPGVFLRVSHYIDWILDNMKP